jgi:uncharacterized membrane protein YhaH (DUF805 family)
MGPRMLKELLHLIVGLVAIHVIAALAAWSVPNAGGSIWWVSLVTTIVVILATIRSIAAARRRDRDEAAAKNDGPRDER